MLIKKINPVTKVSGMAFNINFFNPFLKDLSISFIRPKEFLIEWRKQKYIVKAKTGVRKIFNIKSIQSPELINIESKYYLAEVKDKERKNRPMNDPEVLEALNAQLSFKKKIENNTSLAKDLSLGAFDGNNFKKFADENELFVKDYKISNLKQNDVFDEGLVKRIFLTKDGNINLITNSTFTKSFLLSTKKTEYKKLDKKGNEFEKYEAKARLNLINKIYQSYDENANQNYKVEINQRTIDRVKNSFQWSWS